MDNQTHPLKCPTELELLLLTTLVTGETVDVAVLLMLELLLVQIGSTMELLLVKLLDPVETLLLAVVFFVFVFVFLVFGRIIVVMLLLKLVVSVELPLMPLMCVVVRLPWLSVREEEDEEVVP